MSWGIKANLDPLGAALDKMREDALKQGKDFAKKESNFFLRVMRKISWESAPSRQTLYSVYNRLAGEGKLWSMIRRGGTKTPEAELERRLRARGTFARRWFVASITQPSKWRIRILLVDKATYSSQIAERDGTVEKAKTKTLQNWKSKLDRVASSITRRF